MTLDANRINLLIMGSDKDAAENGQIMVAF